MNLNILGKLGGAPMEALLAEPEVKQCVPTAQSDCNLGKALHSALPHLQMLPCQSNWDGSTPGLNYATLLSLMSSSNPTGLCKNLNNGVAVIGALAGANGPAASLSDLLKFSKWAAHDMLPCLANSCYLSGSNASGANPYPYLDPATVKKIQDGVDTVERLERKIKRDILVGAIIGMIVFIFIGFLIGRASKK